jgi:hypothetical protein
MTKLSSWIAVAIVMALFNISSVCGDENETLDKAIDWLVAQQDESGAFKSKHYGAMKQGAAMTSLALYSMSMTSEKHRENHRDAIQNAFKFLMPGTMARGRVANPDGSLDHPVYSTAMFLVAAHRFEYDIDAELLARLLDFLIRSQCTEGRGFMPENPNYGGWDVIGPDVMAGKTSGTNVSVARFVLEAFECWTPEAKLERVKVFPPLKESKTKAEKWLKRLQKETTDGGFLFTAQPGSALNKAKSKSGLAKAYSTATCDGYLSVNFIGYNSLHDEDSLKVEHWIRTHTNPSNVFGFEEDDQSGWPEALHYYHLQALAKVADAFAPCEWSEKTQTDILALLRDAQKDDGRFQNESALMRENDPLIATSFAIIALSAQ